MIKLKDLKPKLLFGKTQLDFNCPKCNADNSNTHRIQIRVNDTPIGRGWNMTGSTFKDLSLTPSIAHKTEDADFFKDEGHIPRPCESHFFITNGEIKLV